MVEYVCVCVSYLGEHRQVKVPARRHVGQQRRAGGGEGALPVQLCRQVVPVLQTDLKDLRLLHLGHQQHVVQSLRAAHEKPVSTVRRCRRKSPSSYSSLFYSNV